MPTCRSGDRRMACGPTSSSTASSGIAAHASRNSTRDLKLWTYNQKRSVMVARERDAETAQDRHGNSNPINICVTLPCQRHARYGFSMVGLNGFQWANESLSCLFSKQERELLLCFMMQSMSSWQCLRVLQAGEHMVVRPAGSGGRVGAVRREAGGQPRLGAQLGLRDQLPQHCTCDQLKGQILQCCLTVAHTSQTALTSICCHT